MSDEPIANDGITHYRVRVEERARRDLDALLSEREETQGAWSAIQ